MGSGPEGSWRGGVRRGAWVCGVGVGLLALAGGLRAAEAAVETRDFSVLVDGKRVGEAHMTITRQEDGSTTLQCDTDVEVNPLPLISVRYSYRGFEVWKDGRLRRFNCTANDNGKRCTVAAVAEGADLRVRISRPRQEAVERKVRGDVWLTSYWAQPDNKVLNTTVPLLEADTGNELDAKVQFIATESRGVAGRTINVNHFRLSGKVQVDLWYDGDGRLVRQEWMEEGHHTALELNRLRR